MAIQDNPDALRFLLIISNIKKSNFEAIFKIYPSVSDKTYINVKNLFQTTLVIRRQELGLLKKYWFCNPFWTGEPQEQRLIMEAQSNHVAAVARQLATTTKQTS